MDLRLDGRAQSSLVQFSAIVDTHGRGFDLHVRLVFLIQDPVPSSL